MATKAQNSAYSVLKMALILQQLAIERTGYIRGREHIVCCQFIVHASWMMVHSELKHRTPNFEYRIIKFWPWNHFGIHYWAFAIRYS